jgi:hypothetical protein
MKSLTWLVFNSLMTNVTHQLVTLVTPVYDIRRVGGSVYQSAASVAFVIGSEISPVVVDLHLHQNAFRSTLHPTDVVVAATEYQMIRVPTGQVVDQQVCISPCNFTSMVVIFVHIAPSVNGWFRVVENQIFLWCLVVASIRAPEHAACNRQVFVSCLGMTGKICNHRKGRRYVGIERLTRRYQGCWPLCRYYCGRRGWQS